MRDFDAKSKQQPERSIQTIINYRIASIGAVLLVTACAGRAPAPVAVVQPTDRHADCSAIMSQVSANTQQISELGREEGAKVAQNVVMGVAGAFFIVPWLLMDFQNAAGKETTSLQQRNAYLATLAEQRCPGGPTIAAAPPAPGAFAPAAAAPAAAAPVAITPVALSPSRVDPETNRVVHSDRGPPRF